MAVDGIYIYLTESLLIDLTPYRRIFSCLCTVSWTHFAY